jgi:PhzF family phenazine biosynthesis protein
VRIRREGEAAAFAAPRLVREGVAEADLAAALDALGVARERLVDAQWLVNGPRWLALLLDSAAAVLAVDPDGARLSRFRTIGIVGPHPAGDNCAFEVRGFVAQPAFYEDPVTGSLNAGLAEWLIATGRAPDRYVAAQGTRLGRAGRVRIAREGATVWVGGHSTSCIRGDVEL